MTKPIDSRLMFIAGQMLIQNINDIDRPTKKDIREHHKRVIDWAKEIADIAREIRKPVASDEASETTTHRRIVPMGGEMYREIDEVIADEESAASSQTANDGQH